MNTNKTCIYIPKKNSVPLDYEDLSKWYSNLIFEMDLADYTDYELSLFWDKNNYYGKYLSKYSRYFFLNHFARNLVTTINYFFDTNHSNVRYLEIGYGCGNQLLLMALLGADVVGCDVRQDVCDLTKKRKKFYEKISGRDLNISLICENIFNVNWETLGEYDAINFQFSFNELKPYEKIFELIEMLLKSGGRVVFQETNQSNYYNKLFRNRDYKKPKDVVKALESCNFKIHSLRGGYAVPPIFWRFFPENIVERLDQILSRSLYMSPSYHLMAEKI